MKSPGLAETFPGRGIFVLAHQGGWDEILLVVGPLAVIALLLWVANRRVSAQLAAEAAAEGNGGAATAQPASDQEPGSNPS